MFLYPCKLCLCGGTCVPLYVHPSIHPSICYILVSELGVSNELCSLTFLVALKICWLNSLELPPFLTREAAFAVNCLFSYIPNPFWRGLLEKEIICSCYCKRKNAPRGNSLYAKDNLFCAERKEQMLLFCSRGKSILTKLPPLLKSVGIPIQPRSGF